MGVPMRDHASFAKNSKTVIKFHQLKNFKTLNHSKTFLVFDNFVILIKQQNNELFQIFASFLIETKDFLGSL